MKLKFGEDVLVLPARVLACCDKADAAELRVLLWLASDLSLAEKPLQLARLAGCSEKAVNAAISLWVKGKVLTKPTAAEPEKREETDETPAPARPLLQRADTLPVYTTAELADLLEKRQSVRLLIDEAQQIIGKMFNTAEVNILVGMVDYLGMEEDCILLLLAHCKRIGKTNLRAIEKYAYSLVDDGITDSRALEERMRRLEERHTLEGEVRTMFGLSSRALTAKEKKMLDAWISYGYGAEIVRRAYEITVSATNTPSIPYANAILSRWNEEGYRTEAEIDAHIAEEEARKNAPADTTLGNSFDTEDFLDAALQRSNALLKEYEKNRKD